MDELLKAESEKLTRSWMQHEPAWLRDYLVAGVEDPRLNLQSILSRHFLTRTLTDDRFSGLMQQEYRFAAAMGWLTRLAGATTAEDCAVLLHAVTRRADNAEGIEIPQFVLRTFEDLPRDVGGLLVPNYLQTWLAAPEAAGQPNASKLGLDTFRDLWREALCPVALGRETSRPTVLEPACGSANDYRFLESYGLAALLDYTGIDLCEKNIENARGLFPAARFERGNVFELEAPDQSYTLCVVHDLFEHLSIAGMERAVKEICRVTREGICVGFFQMEEQREHLVRPVEDYHWNLLSMARMKALFAQEGFAAQVIHIGTFLRQELGCEQTHNPNAYTFLLRRS